MTAITMSDDESRGLHTGDIIARDGQYWRVAKIVRVNPAIRYDATTERYVDVSGHWSVSLAASTAEKYAARPVRVTMPEHETRLGSAPCRLLPSGEWMHVEKITRSQFEGAAGIGHTYQAHGRIVTAAKAAKLNAAYQAEQAKDRASTMQRQVADYT